MKMLGYAAGGGVVGMVTGCVIALAVGYFCPTILGLDSKDGPLVVVLGGPIVVGIGLVVGSCLGLVLGSKPDRPRST